MVPRKMREEAGMKVFIMRGFEGCLSVYKSSAFEELVNGIETLSFNEKVSRDYIRASLSSVVEIDLDKQGRMSIPTQLMKKYNITSNVVVIGVGDHFEIWNKQIYSKYEKEMNDNYENNAENVHFEQK